MKGELLRRVGTWVSDATGLRVERVRRRAATPLSMQGMRRFGEFVTDEGSRVPLYEGYRDRLKRGWRLDHWATIALYAARERLALDAETGALLNALDAARTLPAPIEQFAACARRVARAYPGHFAISAATTGDEMVAARLTAPQVESVASYYSKVAAMVIGEYRRSAAHPLAASSVTALEMGCGAGHGTFMLATLGVNRSIGIDRMPPDHRALAEQPQVAALLEARHADVTRRVQLIDGDLCAVPLPDGGVDLIHSHAVLEHVRDPAAAFREMARLLRPGGVALHWFYPYFEPAGAHAACTLDFPWGHARLTPTEFRRYLRELRPHEMAHASRQYDEHFPQPRWTLHDFERAIAASGLVTLSWREGWRHDHLPDQAVWREASRLHPRLAPRDLSAASVAVVLTRAAAASAS